MTVLCCNEVDLQMYEMEDGELKLQATYEGLIPVLGYGDKEDDGIFLKKSDDTIYICGSCVNDVYMYANGTLIKSFDTYLYRMEHSRYRPDRRIRLQAQSGPVKRMWQIRWQICWNRSDFLRMQTGYEAIICRCSALWIRQTIHYSVFTEKMKVEILMHILTPGMCQLLAR